MTKKEYVIKVYENNFVSILSEYLFILHPKFNFYISFGGILTFASILKKMLYLFDIMNLICG